MMEESGGEAALSKVQKNTKKQQKRSKGNKVKFSIQMGRSRFVSVHDANAP